MTQPTQLVLTTKATRVRRRKSARPTHAPKPWLAVVLAVDTATRSGWALYVSGRLRGSGEVDTRDAGALGDIIVDARDRAARGGLPLALALESPYGGSPFIVAALGQARERWLQAWRAADGGVDRVVLVQPQTWRARVLPGEWRGASRERVRAAEQRVAAQLAGHAVGGDEAAAILIGRWGARALPVGKALGRVWMKRSIACWRAQG